MPERGRLAVVGCGLQPSRHVSARTVSEIRRANAVFGLADGFAIDWMRTLNPNVEDLSRHYDASRDRRESYRRMQDAILRSLRSGGRVCVVLYGHPSVFAQVGRKSLAQARAGGYATAIEPGISAEACLYADLDLDPGEFGVQSFEATQFLIGHRAVDPHALLLLWQVSQTGNLRCTGGEPDPRRLKLLVEKLGAWYPSDTPALLYEAATLPIGDFRADRIALADLPHSGVCTATTLVIPPATAAPRDEAMLSRLEALDRD